MALASQYLKSSRVFSAVTWSRFCYTRRLLSSDSDGKHSHSSSSKDLEENKNHSSSQDAVPLKASKNDGQKQDLSVKYDQKQDSSSSDGHKPETYSKVVEGSEVSTQDSQLQGEATVSTVKELGATELAEKPKLGKFAKAFEKFTSAEFLTEQLEEEETKKAPKKIDDRNTWSFPKLLRNSKLMQLGDPEGRIVEGKVFHVVNDDLYIDFGAKLHCVCQRPRVNGELYVRGSKVRLRLNKLEMSRLFLGAAKELTLLESDATLIGLIQSPVKRAPAAAQKSA